MFTLFTIPKAFTDEHISKIQINAIKSWKKLNADIEIILLGNEEGIKEIAEKYNLVHVPDIEYSKFGTPFINSVFKKAREKAKYDILCYINCDIITPSNFSQLTKSIPKEKEFLIIGRRWDLDVTHYINYNDSNWENDIYKELDNKGIPHAPSGIDYFVFRKSSLKNFPPFAIGGYAWDNWIVYNSNKNEYATVNATDYIKIIHQNHEYNIKNKKERKQSPLVVGNISLLPKNTTAYAYCILDTKYRLNKKGKLIKNHFLIFRIIQRYYHHIISRNIKKTKKYIKNLIK